MATNTDTSNQYFQLAVRFVNQTNRHLFLTGKAGTGKTTFLRYIRENTFKKMAILAPTGVAAINAGGVTIHSFFLLPFASFIPYSQPGWGGPGNNSNFNTPHTLLKSFRISNDKRQLIQELELLVIDEVSMLRADLLDEIDCVLRFVRKRPHEPFGGVQVLYIGDLYQLPPVVNNEEWDVLKQYYKSPYFFDAQVIQQQPPLYLELKKIYRQQEAGFINILNNIRNNQITAADLDTLHQRYLPGYESPEEENYITLTTHNAKADTINQSQLAKLPGELHEYKGEISGEFNERALPADAVLQLKEGAQVMLIKNDKGETRRYYNGKIGTILRITSDSIFIRFPHEDNELELEKEVWRNIRYQYNNEHDRIEEVEVGSFKQFPLRLAWAITIHKSQGLTFEKAIIDAGASFAPGQVYVALSRLTTLEGLVLYSRIQPHAIHTHNRVIEFTRLEKEEDALEKELKSEQKAFLVHELLQTFDWLKLAEAAQHHFEGYETRQLPDKNDCILWGKILLDTLLKQQEMAGKFTRQLEQLLPTAPQDNYQHLHQRVTAANTWFLTAIEEVLASIKEHIDAIKAKPKVKKYVKELQGLYILPARKKLQLKQALQITAGFSTGATSTDLLQLVEAGRRSEDIATPEVTGGVSVAKSQKGDSHRMTLQLFREGKSVAEIAEHRNLSIGTIEGHLTSFITTGEIDIKEIVPENKIEAILQAIEAVSQGSDKPAATPVKEKLGDAYTYNEIRAVYNYKKLLSETRQ